MASRRTHWRRLALLAVLLDQGPCNVADLEAATRRAPGTLYGDLIFLERAGLVAHRPERDARGRPARTLYRAIPAVERAAAAIMREAGDLATGMGEPS